MNELKLLSLTYVPYFIEKLNEETSKKFEIHKTETNLIYGNLIYLPF